MKQLNVADPGLGALTRGCESQVGGAASVCFNTLPKLKLDTSSASETSSR